MIATRDAFVLISEWRDEFVEIFRQTGVVFFYFVVCWGDEKCEQVLSTRTPEIAEILPLFNLSMSATAIKSLKFLIW